MFEIIIKNSDVIKGCRSMQAINDFYLTAHDKDGNFIEIRDGRMVSQKVVFDKNPVQCVDNTETRSPFHSTVDGMLSDDYKERFKAEYKQTKIRYERLHTFNTKILASKINVESEEPKHDCPESVLLDQEKTMKKYLEILELRAAIEKIDLM